MKHLILFLIVLLGAFCSHAQLTNGLVAHWSFNGNANDVSGNGHHGTATNVVYTTGSQGTPNTAVRFNGTNSFVIVPYHNSFNVDSFSICAKVIVQGYYTGTCQGNIILQRGADFESGHYTLHFSDNMFNSCYISDTSKHVFYSHVRGKTPFNSTLQYFPTIISGSWYCVINTYANDTLRVYVNGILKNTVQLTPGVIGASTKGISIGASRYGPYQQYPYWLNGAIDDLRLYNRALTASEINSYCGSLQPPTPEVSISQPLSPTSFCPGDVLNVPYTVTSPFNAGNVFTAQLSDAAGNFANPVNIGSVTATGAGVINCTIPNNTPAGNGYRVRIMASNPASTSSDNGVNLVIKTAPTINAAPIQAVCIGDDLQLNAGVNPASSIINWKGPGGFTATGNMVIISNAQKYNSGNYIIAASNGTCTITDTIEAIVDSNKADLGKDTTLCNNETILLYSGTKGATHIWQNGSNTDSFLVKDPGTYHVTATLGSCVAKDTIDIEYIRVVIDLPEDTAICAGTSITLSVPDTFDSYTWNVIGSEDQPSVNISEPGIYQVIVNKGKCKGSRATKVEVQVPYFLLGKDTSICLGNTIKLQANSIPGSEYYWQDGTRGNTYIVNEPGFYFVTAYNDCGTFSDNINVDFENCDCTPIMPTAFTPNNDGLNDDIGPILRCNPKKYRFVIANRWGEIVFDTENKDRKWDGEHYGKTAGMDVYNYFIKVTDPTGEESIHSGNIMLLR